MMSDMISSFFISYDIYQPRNIYDIIVLTMITYAISYLWYHPWVSPWVSPWVKMTPVMISYIYLWYHRQYHIHDIMHDIAVWYGATDFMILQMIS